MGRPGGGGIGRPVALSGGRVAPSPSPAPPRWVGRIVVGPSGETRARRARASAARRASERPWSRSRRVPGALRARPVATGRCAARSLRARRARVTARGARAGRRRVRRVARAPAAAWRVGGLGRLRRPWSPSSALAGSAGTSRRSPSASARRRMRSAWASSIDADGLEAPIPSFWASASNSLLVSPSSLESSCTRIFFGAKTFPYFACPHVRRAQFPILSQLRPFLGRETAHRRELVLGRGPRPSA